jgi:hypothetical protein
VWSEGDLDFGTPGSVPDSVRKRLAKDAVGSLVDAGDRPAGFAAHVNRHVQPGRAVAVAVALPLQVPLFVHQLSVDGS